MKLGALSAAIAAFACASTIYAVQAAPIINGKVYEESVERNCGVEDFCGLAFTKVAAGKTLTLNKVSCVILKSAVDNAFALAVGQGAGPGDFAKRPQFLTPVKLGVGSGIQSYQSSDSVALILKPNSRPVVTLSVPAGPPGSIVLSCTIVGRTT